MEIRRRIQILRQNRRIFGNSLYRKPRMVLRVAANYSRVLLWNQRPFRFLDIALSYACNFSCTHCSALPMLRKERRKMSVDDYRCFARSAMKAGATVFHFTGGEPLLHPELFEIIDAFQPSRNFISIQSNGFVVTEQHIKDLCAAGVDIFAVSLDSSVPEEHDAFRKREGSFERALQAAELARRHGLSVSVSSVVTHQNLYTREFRDLLDLIGSMGASGFFNLAVPIGHWAGNYADMITPEDRREIERIIAERPYLRTDFESTWVERGCSAMKEKAYLSPYGDVLPCPFIQTAYGNVLEEDFATILARGRAQEDFRAYHPYCPAAESMEFVQKHACYDPATSSLPVPFRPEPTGAEGIG